MAGELVEAADELNRRVSACLDELAEAAVSAACPAAEAAKRGISEEEAREVILRERMCVVRAWDGRTWWVELDGRPFAGLRVRLADGPGAGMSLLVEPFPDEPAVSA